jgi:hypothetical protein
MRVSRPGATAMKDRMTLNGPLPERPGQTTSVAATSPDLALKTMRPLADACRAGPVRPLSRARAASIAASHASSSLAACHLAGSGDDPGAAEIALQVALAVARQQGARLWELRSAYDLARLWAEQGERQKAHEFFAPICGWFTEGFDTPDLKAAKELLEELRV